MCITFLTMKIAMAFCEQHSDSQTVKKLFWCKILTSPLNNDLVVQQHLVGGVQGVAVADPLYMYYFLTYKTSWNNI